MKPQRRKPIFVLKDPDTPALVTPLAKSSLETRALVIPALVTPNLVKSSLATPAPVTPALDKLSSLDTLALETPRPAQSLKGAHLTPPQSLDNPALGTPALDTPRLETLALGTPVPDIPRLETPELAQLLTGRSCHMEIA